MIACLLDPTLPAAPRRAPAPPAAERSGAARCIQVLIVEDDADTHSRLESVIRAQPDMRLSGVGRTLREAREALHRAVHDVIVVDLGLPDGSGLELIREARARDPMVEVMIYTVIGDGQAVLAAIEAGATGYLLKDSNSEEVAVSIRALVAGGSPISPSIARHVLRRLSVDPRETRPAPRVSLPSAERPVLTSQETRVLQTIAKGFTYDEVAASLGISLHTVATHIKHIYRKLAVRSRGEAVFEAMQLGLITVHQGAYRPS